MVRLGQPVLKQKSNKSHRKVQFKVQQKSQLEQSKQSRKKVKQSQILKTTRKSPTNSKQSKKPDTKLFF